MSFPDYRETGSFFSVKKKIPDGWEPRGQMPSFPDEDGVTKVAVHSYCHTRLNIGIEEDTGEAFKYCPMCLCKISDPEPDKPEPNEPEQEEED